MQRLGRVVWRNLLKKLHNLILSTVIVVVLVYFLLFFTFIDGIVRLIEHE